MLSRLKIVGFLRPQPSIVRAKRTRWTVRFRGVLGFVMCARHERLMIDPSARSRTPSYQICVVDFSTDKCGRFFLAEKNFCFTGPASIIRVLLKQLLHGRGEIDPAGFFPRCGSRSRVRARSYLTDVKGSCILLFSRMGEHARAIIMSPLGRGGGQKVSA